MTLTWDYQKCTCDNSMQGYITNFLDKLQNDKQKHPQHTSPKYVMPAYCENVEYATTDEIPHLSAKQYIKIQKSLARYYTMLG